MFRNALMAVLVLTFVGLYYAGFNWGYGYTAAFRDSIHHTWSSPYQLTITKVGSVVTTSTDHTLSDTDGPVTRRFDSMTLVSPDGNVSTRHNLEVDGDWKVGHHFSVRINKQNGVIVPAENVFGITNPWVGGLMVAFLAAVIGTAALFTLFDILFGIIPEAPERACSA